MEFGFSIATYGSEATCERRLISEMLGVSREVSGLAIWMIKLFV